MDEKGQIRVGFSIPCLKEDRKDGEPSDRREVLKRRKEPAHRGGEIIYTPGQDTPEEGRARKEGVQEGGIKDPSTRTGQELVSDLLQSRGTPLLLAIKEDAEAEDCPRGGGACEPTPHQQSHGEAARPDPSGEGGSEEGGAQPYDKSSHRARGATGPTILRFPCLLRFVRALLGTQSPQLGWKGYHDLFHCPSQSVPDRFFYSCHGPFPVQMIMKDCGEPSAGERGGAYPLRGWRGLFVLLLLSLPLLLPAGEAAGQEPPPNLSYLTLHTDHLRITFPTGMEETARRSAERAEAAYALLAASFLPPPSGKIDILLTDHLDFSNGSAQATPSNRITIWIQPPIEGMDRSYFEDWLDSVILHEMAHIFHFELTGTPGEILRSVFGRVPRAWPYFPAHSLPDLFVEGVGVYLESLHTGTGRIDGTFFEATLRALWLEGEVERLDQGLGVTALWPGGNREYLYGALFLNHLAERYGEEALLSFLLDVGEAWIPYRLDPPARRAFGHSLGELWDAWAAEVVEEGRRIQNRIAATNRGAGPGNRGAGPEEVELLSRTGGMALFPAAGIGGGVAYLRTDNRSDPQLRLLTSEGDRSLARWNGGMAPVRWMYDGSLLLSQAEFVDGYRIYRDLYRVTLEGSVTRLTRGSRILHADPHPGGEGIVAVIAAGEVNRLVLLSNMGEEVRTLRDSEPGVLWSYPAWSPDGSQIAVARRRPGGWTAILLLNSEGALLHEVAEDLSLNSLPAWGPGGTTLLWGSDRSGIPNLYGVRLGEGGDPGESLQITDLVTAGIFPSVDPEGEWIYLSLLTGAGWEVARTPYRTDSWFTPLPLDPRFDPGRERRAEAAVVAGSAGEGRVEVATGSVGSELWEVRPYSAFGTVLPTYWLPIRKEGVSAGEDRILPQIWGARISGSDLVRRHRYALSLLAPLRAPRERTEWVGRYSWAGLGNPLLILDATQSWSLRGKTEVPGGPPGDTLYAVQRERYIGGSVEFSLRRVRQGASLSIGGGRVAQDRSFRTSSGEDSDRIALILPHRSLGELRLSGVWSNARGFPLSVSTEKGVSLSLNLRERQHLSLPDSFDGVSGADGGFREAVGVFRGYLPLTLGGFANHILALRVSGGVAKGPGAGAGHFALGGYSGLLPVRGFAQGVLFGEAGWSVSGEWRFPIRVLHRGFGPWPLYLDRLAGSLFVDFAGTGGGEGNRETRGSAGAEVVLSHTLIFDGLDRIRVGVALPTVEGDRASVYIRSGWSF